MKPSAILKISAFFILLMTCTNAGYGQSDTLNRSDLNGQKTGWWIIYLDKDLKEVDSSSAVYFRYGYFNGKFNYYSMGPVGTKKAPVAASEITTSSGLHALNGIYTSNYKNGKVRFELRANNGKLVSYKEWDKKGGLRTYFDYTSSCGDDFLHYCIMIYKADGTLKEKTTIQNP